MVKNMTTCSIAGLLADRSFLEYVLEADAKQAAYWKSYSDEHPHSRVVIARAKDILLHLDRPTPHFSDDEIEALKRRLKVSLYAGNSRKMAEIPIFPTFLSFFTTLVHTF